MTRDSKRYSTIRKEQPNRGRSNDTMDQLYELLIKPHSIVVIVGTYFGLFNMDLLDYIEKATKGDQYSAAHLSVLLLSVVVGARVIQSLYLARRDYSRLDSSPIDIPIFLMVIIFTSGGLLKIKATPLVLAIYTILAFAGTLNFFYLYIKRIHRSDEFDYPIERKIQAVNAAVFFCLTGLTTVAALAGHRENYKLLHWAIAASCILTLINIVHSQHLTMLPKFLLRNEPDSIANSIKTFREIFGHILALKKDEEIAGALFARRPADFRLIKTVRATAADADLICMELLRSFPYIFKYIFDATDERLRSTLRRMIASVGGLGTLGYLSFYFIVNDEGEKVGLFKIDTAHGNWLYRMVEVASLPFTLAFGLRTLKILGIWRRAHRALSGQAPPQRKELRLTYLIIFSRHRKRGYGAAFLRLLQNAFLYSNTNDIIAECITLFVREKNLAAIHLFERTGFSPLKRDSQDLPDPFAEAKGVGRAIFMERRLS